MVLIQMLPGGSEVLELLTVTTLERLVTFFWEVLNIRWPVIHKATFKAHEADVDVVLGITVFAAARAPLPADQQLASILLPILRGSFLSVCPARTLGEADAASVPTPHIPDDWSRCNA